MQVIKKWLKINVKFKNLEESFLYVVYSIGSYLPSARPFLFTIKFDLFYFISKYVS